MNKQYIFTMRVIIIGLLLTAFACTVIQANENAKKINLKDPQYSDLDDRIKNYYQYEVENKWEMTYEFRTPSFKNTVSIDVYIKQMEKDNAGWELAEYNILTALATSSNSVMLEMSFIENINDKSEIWGFMKGKHDKLSFKDYSVWEKIGGVWYCKSAGARTHLSLNNSF